MEDSNHKGTGSGKALYSGNNLYRRQFLAGPHHPKELSSWNQYKFGTICLTVHPECELNTATSDDSSIVLIGEIFDPEKPTATNLSVVRNLVESCTSFPSLESALESMAGRWIVLVRIGRDARVYPDCCGSKSVVYLEVNHSSGFWFASQPELIKMVVDLRRDDWFGRYLPYGTPAPFSWPVEQTPYPEVRKLLPNSYLDLCTGTAERFWPLEEFALSLEPRDYVVSTGVDLMNGIMQSAANRNHLGVFVTAGYDSRVLLALSQKISGKIEYFTVARPGDTPEYDWQVPEKLLAKYNSELNIVQPTWPPEDFKLLFDKSVSGMIRGTSAINAYTYLSSLPNHYTFLTGHCAEVVRCFFYQKGDVPNELGSARQTILRLVEGLDPKLQSSIATWFEKAPRYTNLHLLDLYYWECRLGTWLAMEYTGSDIAISRIPLYNCRKLLCTLLQVDMKDRCQPYPVFRDLCEKIDSKVVALPFNEPIQ